MNLLVTLVAGLALLGATLATPAMAQSGKRAVAKADSARTSASSSRSTAGGYSPSNPNVDTTICY
jgi:hypothetical protein